MEEFEMDKKHKSCFIHGFELGDSLLMLENTLDKWEEEGKAYLDKGERTYLRAKVDRIKELTDKAKECHIDEDIVKDGEIIRKEAYKPPVEIDWYDLSQDVDRLRKKVAFTKF